jgi:hypothetical protein
VRLTGREIGTYAIILVTYKRKLLQSEHTDNMWKRNEMSLKQNHKTALKNDHLGKAEEEGRMTLPEIIETEGLRSKMQ